MQNTQELDFRPHTQANFNYLQNLCVHEIFQLQVERSPQVIAVICENAQLSYEKLNQRANQLAHHLRQLGVKPEVPVGIYLERSLEMIIGVLGVLKAGGCYVPLDPAYPHDRLAFILEDTQTPVILTQEKFITSLPPHQAQVISLDSDWGEIAKHSPENLLSQATSDNLIYTIYTSGSTGRPKGVMIPHRGISNQIFWRQTTFGLTSTDKVLQNISFSFDPSVWQIFWPLCYGAQLVLSRPTGHKDTKYLVHLIIEQQITVIAVVPSILRVLLEEPGIENCQCLRHVTCGGEALPLDLIRRFYTRLNLDKVLHNCYGPTESSIDATFWTSTRQISTQISTVTAPIGVPITNTEIYILDENLQPVPTGETGELHIGGMGLARGYLHLPELTAEKFIPHPFKQVPGERVYKTGDLGRYLPDGNIEFLGRVDSQVKIRGFRIELGEIETILSQYPGITQTVVVVREDFHGDKRLVAYIVPQNAAAVNIEQLRSFLKEQLPEYMIPTNFVVLNSLPLTPNGKVNRQDLPAPDYREQKSKVAFVAPRNAIEYELTEIWQELLGIRPIGIKDNFFELGGHSLLAIKLFRNIQQKFAQDLPLSVLFQSGTIETIAEIISECQKLNIKQVSSAVGATSSLVTIQPHGSKPPFFCIHGLGGEVLCFRKLALHLGSDQPFYGIQPIGLDGKTPPYTKVEDMAFHYIQEIRTIQSQGPYFLGGYSFGGIIGYEIARQLLAQGEEVRKLVIFDACLPGYEWRSPLWKRIFLHLGNILTQGPAYLQQKLKGWSKQVKYQNQNQSRYRRYLEEASNLSPTDKHLEIIGINDQAAREYALKPYPGQIILMRTEDKHRDNSIGQEYVSHFGWGDLAEGGLEIHYVPGSHVSLFDEPHVEIMAAKLKDCLTTVLKSSANF